MRAPAQESAEEAVLVVLAGGLALEWPGRRLDVRLRRRRAEVAFVRLAIDAGATVSREALAEAVWDEEWPASWESSVRNLIAVLRGWLAGAGAEGWLATTRDGYRLTLPMGSLVDVQRSERGAEQAEALLRDGDAAGALARAERELEASRGDVLGGVPGRWVETLRAEAAVGRMRLLRVLGEAALDSGDTARAERVARRLVAVEPFREEGHRLLMRALRAAGNGGEALIAFDACRRTLARALGAMPSATTQSLFMEILAEEGGQASAAPAGHGRGRAFGAGPLLLLVSQTPFVGRRSVLDGLADRLRAAREAGPQVAIIAGEPGLGKTRLAAELAARADAEGISVLYGRAEDRLTIAYRAALEALEAGVSALGPETVINRLGEHGAIMSRLLPSLSVEGGGASVATGLDELDRWRLEQGVIATLQLLAEPGGALLVLDDMHWASSREWELIDAIAERAELPVLVLVLGRSEGARIEPGPGRPPRPDRVHRVALAPMTVSELAQLVQASGPPDAREDAEAAASRLWSMTAGNPLLAAELLQSWSDGRAHGRPARLEELVRERLSLLSAQADSVLRVAAVAGQEFDPRVVAAASDLPDEDAARALARAQRAHLLVSGTGDPRWLAFRHALVRAALLDGLSTRARSDLHRRIGLVVEPQALTDPQALVNAAYHFGAATQAGEWRRAVRYGLPVARAAYEAGVYEDVVTVAARALDALRNAGDPDPGTRLDLEVLLGGAQRALSEPTGTDQLLSAFAHAREREDPRRMADAALAFTDAGAASGEAYIDDGLTDTYEEALAALGGTEPRRRALLLGHLASAYAWKRSGPRAMTFADDALDLARRLHDRATLARVLTTTRRALTGLGRLDRIESMEDELMALAEHFDDPGQRARALLWRCESSIQRGRGAELEQLVSHAADAVAVLRMGAYHHSLAYIEASLALLRGDLPRAERLVERAAAIGLERGAEPFVVEAIRTVQMFAVRREQGRLDEIQDAVRNVFASAGVSAWTGMVSLLELELGHFDGLLDNVDGLLDAHALTGATMAAPLGLLAQMAEPVTACADVRRAALVYDALAPYTGQGGYVSYFTGPIDYHLGILAHTLGRHHDAQRHLGAAAGFSEQLGAPLWVDRCRAALDRTDRLAAPAGSAGPRPGAPTIDR